jgi:hypothetical protein
VRLRVDHDGEVLDVELKNLEDAEPLREVQRTLQYWMFLPTIKDGRAVADYANLPVRF